MQAGHASGSSGPPLEIQMLMGLQIQYLIQVFKYIESPVFQGEADR